SLKAAWQAREIATTGADPVIFVDEPVLACFGTPALSWDAPRVRAALDRVYSAAGFPVGTHCCSNTDWSILFESAVSVISFDAFGFADTFLIYRDPLASFLRRGGNIAWGIVPTGGDELSGADPRALADRLFDLARRAARTAGIPENDVLRRSLVTPACGLGTRPRDVAERALAVALDVSRILRRSLGLAP
ncbi:MAG: methionine synthase, partial [Planctomycetota bacterium]|nr:methionine synthase [Planctomycetota bacterium]